MTAEAILIVSTLVVGLTQYLKWAGVRDAWGPGLVLVLSAIGVGAWAYSIGTYVRTELFSYLAGWVAVFTSAAGVYGFTRASGDVLTKMQAPPSGAGAEPTVKA